MAPFWLCHTVPKRIWALFSLWFPHVGWRLKGRLVSVFSQTQWQWNCTGRSKSPKPCPLKLPKLGTGGPTLSNLIPSKIGQPYICPKDSKNSLCWLESGGRKNGLLYIEHCWTLFRWRTALLCKLFVEGTIVFSSYPCKIGMVQLLTTVLRKWLMRGSRSARCTSQSSV